MELNGVEIEYSNMRDVFLARTVLGDKPLLICEGETLTYRGADEQSNRIAQSMAALGIAKGDVVATFMYNSVDHAAVWLACVKLGAIFASLNVSLAANELVYSLGDTKAKMIVLDHDLMDVYSEAKPGFSTVPLEVLWRGPEDTPGFIPFPKLLEGENVLPDVAIAPNDPMSIIYTGGSTSMPKGVLAPHLHYIGAAERYKEITQSRPDDVHFANSHFFHVGGQQFGLMGPLVLRHHGRHDQMVQRLQLLAESPRETGATIIDPIGTMISALLSLEPSNKTEITRFGSASALPRVRFDPHSDRVRGAVRCAAARGVRHDRGRGVCCAVSDLDDKTKDSCGKTYGWADICIVDENECPVPTGEQGQILLPANWRPTAFMLEYINKPEETIAAWRNLWYHSRRYRLPRRGRLPPLCGRQAHWVRVRGENVSAFEVEKVLSAHEAVKDCAIVGVPARSGRRRHQGVRATRGRRVLEPSEVVSWCTEQLAYFKVPRFVEYVTSSPHDHEARDRAPRTAGSRHWGLHGTERPANAS